MPVVVVVCWWWWWWCVWGVVVVVVVTDTLRGPTMVEALCECEPGPGSEVGWVGGWVGRWLGGAQALGHAHRWVGCWLAPRGVSQGGVELEVVASLLILPKLRHGVLQHTTPWVFLKGNTQTQ